MREVNKDSVITLFKSGWFAEDIADQLEMDYVDVIDVIMDYSASKGEIDGQ